MWKNFSKADRRILSTALALLLSMLYLLYDDSLISPSEEASTPGIAYIGTANNDIRRKSSTRHIWRSARKTDTLHSGDSVFVGENSSTTLEFNNGRKITLQENSLIVVGNDKNQLQLDLKYGRFSGLLAKGTKLVVNGKQIEVKESKETSGLNSGKGANGKNISAASGGDSSAEVEVEIEIELGVDGVVHSTAQVVAQDKAERAAQLAAKEKSRFAAKEKAQVAAKERAALLVAKAKALLAAKEQALNAAKEKALLAQAAKVHLLNWTQPPPAQLLHKNHNIPMDVSWKSDQPEGRYRLQLSGTNDFTKIDYQEPVRKNELQTFAYPNSGKFFVRIEAQDNNGEALAHTEIAEMTIIDMSPPEITSPKEQDVFTFKSDDYGKFESPPVVPVQWKYEKKSAQFEVQISVSEDFSTIIWTATASEKTATADGLNQGKYFVRVRDLTPVPGAEQSWSNPVSFQLNYKFPNLKAPELLTKKIDFLAPSNRNIIFKWTPISGVPQYVVEVAKTPDFVEKQAFSTAETNFILKEFSAGHSYFRVFSSSKAGDVGLPSDTGELIVKVKRPTLDPVAPKLVLGKSPEDPGSPQDFDLSWTDLKLADNYIVEVTNDPAFRRITKYSTIDYRTKVTVPQPGQYYARVKGVNKTGQAITRYSEPQLISYKLRIPLATPKLVEPLDQMTLFFQKSSSPYVWLEWKAVRQALTYHVEVALDPAFERKVLTVATRSRRYLIKEPLPQGLLYWRIRARGEATQISNWSEPRLMTIFVGKVPDRRLPASRRR